MTYHPDYKGCPGCGAVEDVDCTCTGEDYVIRDGEGRVLEIVTACGEHILTADFERVG
jgi:hypothetical protein